MADAARKLGVRPGSVLVLVGAPPGWALTDLPSGVEPVHLDSGRPSSRRNVATIVCFVRRREDLDNVGLLVDSVWPAGGLWLAWPRRAGGHRSDLTDNVVRDAVLPFGLVDNKVAAIDADWSGLRFVWRKELRATHPSGRT